MMASGIVIVSSEVQLLNTSEPSFETPDGISILSFEQPENAAALISVTVSGIETFSSEEQPEKKLFGMAVSPAGSFTVF